MFLRKIKFKNKRLLANPTTKSFSGKNDLSRESVRLCQLVGDSAKYPSTSNDPREKLFIYDWTASNIETGYCLEVGSYLGEIGRAHV